MIKNDDERRTTGVQYHQVPVDRSNPVQTNPTNWLINYVKIFLILAVLLGIPALIIQYLTR